MQKNKGRDIKEIQQYWEGRAALGQLAGSRDAIAKIVEIEAIAKYVRDGMRILEVGCGNGATAIELAKRFDIDLLGIDYAENMVEAAKSMASEQVLRGRVKFAVGDASDVLGVREDFDLIYTERVLINLQDWPAQKKTIEDITNRLRPGGVYVMCENSQDGLRKINELREMVGLTSIEPPWHNIYFRDDDLNGLQLPNVFLEKVDCYSATYYFLSRVVNAWLAKQEGSEPAYDAPINMLALKLPAMGDTAQGRIWLWRRSN